MTTKPLDLAQFEGHTPGPWTERTNNWSRLEILYTNGMLASVSKWDDPASPPPIPEMKANARLIAAAPALLSECRKHREQIKVLWEVLLGLLGGDSQTWAQRADKARSTLEATK